uniref:Rab3 GTPase-activating protein catalytic subunit n=1 Tax=Syphacia muris TaxID=451379 RepID=A0A0N5AJP2_9BILA
MAESDVGNPVLSTEVFQIDDFTVSTPFEILVAQLEMMIHDWGLGKGAKNNNFQFKRDMSFRIEWESKSEKITFNGIHSFSLTHYWPSNISRSDEKQEEESQIENSKDSYYTNSLRLLTSNELDFAPGSIITLQFAVLEFLVVTSHNWLTDSSFDENQLNFVLSAIYNDMPVFVQYGEFAGHTYTGVSQNDSVRTEFLTSNIAHQLTRHSNANGLKEIFSNRLNLSYLMNVNATVSLMVDFILQERPQAESVDDGNFEAEYLPDFSLNENGSYFSFGPDTDVVKAIGVSSVWLNMDIHWFSEDENTKWYPFDAPDVYAFVDFNSGVRCALHHYLKTLIDTSVSKSSTLRILTVLENAGYDENSLGRAAFASLAPNQNISITNPAGLAVYEGMTKKSILRCIDAIFAKNDFNAWETFGSSTSVWSETTESRAPGIAIKQTVEKNTNANNPDAILKVVTSKENLMEIIERFKSAPCNSLTSRIAIALTQVLEHEETGILSFAQLWFAIVDELRYRWETDQCLPGLDYSVTPDHRMCRLHQKLQMLQCCINNKIKRHKLFDENNSAEQSSDEYFDADDWISEDASENLLEDRHDKNTLPDAKGRNRQLNIYLSEYPDIPIYEPFLQQDNERCPMTEDMLENYTNYLISLESSESRNKAQLDSLRSDIQAFKAANPGCIFEDFIRWHSPNDLIKDEFGVERLSNRMQGDDNIWIETWRDASPQPIKFQKRLFNETKEAELILQEFSSLTISDLVELIFPVVLKCAAKQIVEECKIFNNTI